MDDFNAKPFNCKFCTHTSDTKCLETFMKHRCKQCKFCDYKGICNNMTQKHVASVHFNEKVECHICKKKLTVLTGLKDHIKKVH